jgi:NitT/TauT family transport system ATP-binding protein/sulfonate transport system ATP-binding protein
MSSSISIQGVNRIYIDTDGKAVEALKGIDLDIRPGELISLIGPSGCGKTTLLRLIAGLDKPQAGQLDIDGKKISGVDTDRGYVFQQGSLFPWLTIEKNIAYGLRARGVYKKDRQKVG